ncbi:MAG: DUF1385 domain-containing protein [Oscillospiraceae bacterium]|nr:DUF1385 domain-containing protein [Oscillospiraceae bacterium]
MIRAKEKVKKKTSIGGQALIEGVMMRGPDKTSMAVRHVSGEIVLKSWATAGKNRAKFFKLPFIRGVFNFIDSMAIGYRCLMRSAEMAGLDDDTASQKIAPSTLDTVACDNNEPGSECRTENSKPETATSDKSKSRGLKDFGMTLILIVSAVLGVLISIGLFMTLPVFLFNHLRVIFPMLDNNIWRAVIEGFMRILLFVAYIFAVSFMKDIRRVFMYHGAEHKTIFCYEKGEELTIENVRRQIRFHPRCGTSFMILMLIVGIVISIFIKPSIPIVRTGIKILTIPLIVSIGYELIKLAGRSDHWIVRAISAPGLWLQRVTTKEPTDDMIEVAIKAFKAVIPDNPESDRL